MVPVVAIGLKVLGAVFTGDRLRSYGRDYRSRYLRASASEILPESDDIVPDSPATETPTA